MSKENQYNRRYVGPISFEAKHRRLFFGREKDIEQFYNFVRLRKISVLYGKSGLGKTSLLNVGIIPSLEEDIGKGQVASFRFINRPRINPEKIEDKFVHSIFQDLPKDTFLDKITNEDTSYWFQFKKLQIKYGSNYQFYIVLDQFEELFTYPEEEINSFSEKLGLLLSNNISETFRLALRKAMSEKTIDITDEQLNLIYEPVKVSVILAIRSDRLSLLDQLTRHIPHILQNLYELKPLTVKQAKDAIQKPAGLIGNFESPEFSLTPQSIDTIIDDLTNGGESFIESFQLQLICQHIESEVIRLRSEKSLSNAFFQLDIRNIRFKIDHIIQDFYYKVINDIPEHYQKNVRKFLEEGLIFEEQQQRISLFEGQIRKEYSIDKSLLDTLLSTHIIRSEKSTGGYYYELSHDSFVLPILELKKIREYKEQEQKEKEEYEKRKKAQEELNDFRTARQLRDLDKKKVQLMEENRDKYRLRQLIYSQLKESKKQSILLGLFIVVILSVLIGMINFGIKKNSLAKSRKQEIEQLNLDIKSINSKLDQQIIQIDSLNTANTKNQLNQILDEYEDLIKDPN